MKRILIIGAGVAGMTAGILLAEEGYDVTLLERGAHVGGNLTGWTRDGCHIDNCLHWLTGTRENTRLGNLWRRLGVLGKGVAIRRGECFYRSVMGEDTLALWRDPERTRREMHRHSPADREEIDRFLDAVCALRNGGAAARARTVLTYGRVTLHELAARFQSPLIRALLTDYIGGEYSSLGLIFAYGAFAAGNADLPAGGSRAMAERMASRFRALGGRILLSRRVSRVLTEGRRISAVLTANGEAYDADAVIFACDPHVTFDVLLPEQMRPRTLTALDENPRFPHVSALHVAYSVNEEDCALRGTVCFSGRAGKHAARAGGRMALRVFDHEADFAPEGKLVLQVMLFVTQADADAWINLRKNPERYRKEKDALARAVTDALVAEFPTLAPSLTLLDAWTPATYARYTGAYHGNFIGYVLTGKAIPPRIPTKIRGSSNGYLASGWMRMPSGLPSAARAGATTAERVIRDLRRSEVLGTVVSSTRRRKSTFGY